MPIKPENKARYPNDWPAIRTAILERAGNRCERCKVLNRTRIARGGGDDTGTYMTADAEVYDDTNGMLLTLGYQMSNYHVLRMTDIVLTIAHLDHTPENCDPANLQALCQKCHLAYDAKHHAASAQQTRRARLAVGDLFAWAEGGER